MIELVIVYCLSADPTHCIEQRDPFADFDSIGDCNDRAELVATQYLAGHPKWKLQRWRCEIDKPREDPA